MDKPVLIWRGIAPVRVEDGVQVEGPEVEREAMQALQAVAEAAYRYRERWLCGDALLFEHELRDALEAAGFDTARGVWRTEAT